MIKGIIFDLDGVLMDSMYIWKEIGKRIVRSYGKTPADNLGDILFPMSFSQAAVYMIENYNLDANAEEIVENVKKLVEDFYLYEVLPKKGVKELLEQFSMRGIRMNVATTSNKVQVLKALERNGLSKFLDGIYTVEEVGKSKHEPDVYIKAADKLNLNPDEIAVFEDSYIGAKTAKNAGFKVVGVFDSLGEINQEELEKISDMYVYSYDELRIDDLLNL